MSVSRDLRAELSLLSSPEKRAVGDGGRDTEEVRLDILVQNERRSVSAFAIGEVVTEISDAGVDVPEPGEPGSGLEVAVVRSNSARARRGVITLI